MPGVHQDADDVVPLTRCAARDIFEELGVLVDPALRARLAPPERTALGHALLDHEARPASAGQDSNG